MKYDSNVLLVVAGESMITIAVFTETTLDFIRCIDISSRSGDLDKYTDDCTREIGAVVQYYEIEAAETANDKWDTIIAFDGASTDADDLKGRLEKMMNSEVHICCKQNVYSDAPVEQNDSIGGASIVAVGLAMKAFADSSSSSNININLVPSATEDVIATKKFALITTNLAAVAILVIFLIAGFVRVKLSKIPLEAQAQKQNTSTNDIRTLLSKGRELNKKIAALEEKKSKISEVFKGRYFGDWGQLLIKIRNNIPTAMSVSVLSCSDGENLTIKGHTPTRQSAYLFARLLSDTKAIKSATVEQTNKSDDGGGLDYSINCVLVNDEETDNAER
jgi:Tfp pilus assembly protein PilN